MLCIGIHIPLASLPVSQTCTYVERPPFQKAADWQRERPASPRSILVGLALVHECVPSKTQMARSNPFILVKFEGKIWIEKYNGDWNALNLYNWDWNGSFSTGLNTLNKNYESMVVWGKNFRQPIFLSKYSRLVVWSSRLNLITGNHY